LNLHAIGVHGLASVELPVLEGANDLLGEALSLGLEVLDLIFGLALSLKGSLDRLHVTCVERNPVSANPLSSRPKQAGGGEMD